MTREKGRPKRGRLADMANYPTPDDVPYEPPGGVKTDEHRYTTDLDRGHRMGVVQIYLENRSDLVYFSVWQSIRHEGKWHSVARIDCSHGTVHRHQFTRNGDNIRTTLEVIPTRGAWEMIGRWFDVAEAMMETEWADNVRRWHGDDA